MICNDTVELIKFLIENYGKSWSLKFEEHGEIRIEFTRRALTGTPKEILEYLKKNSK